MVFEEELDFSTFLGESKGGRPPKEYLLTIDMGKELGMVERNEQGKKIRKYFIELEKSFKELSQTATIEDLIIRQAKSMKEIKQKQKEQKEEIDNMKDTLLEDGDDWRSWVNNRMKAVCSINNNYGAKYKESYDKLEERASCRLGVRLNNLKDRKKRCRCN